MTDFHFIRPWWLLAFVLIALIAYLLKHLRVSQSGWQQVIPKHLASTLLSNEHQKNNMSIITPCLIAFITIIALAGPAWEKLPQPVYSVKKGAVVVLDLSTSMYATDIAPNRLTRARFKVLDLLEKLHESEVGLIAYAGDSFVISPLTEDINNIKLLLPELAPNIMPVQGSNPLLALSMADDMLKNAGHIEGDVYWLTDEADQYDVEEITSFLSSIKHHINILGVGTRDGAPIKLPNGQLLKDNSGAIVIPYLTESALSLLAQRGRGVYQTLTNSANDIDTLISALESASLEDIKKEKSKETTSTKSDTYKDTGPYVLLLIIPLILPYFRRGSLLAVLPCCLWFSHMPDSMAQQSLANDESKYLLSEANETNNAIEDGTKSTVWSNLWQTQNQQAQHHYQNQNFQQAAEQFTDPMWQGSAHYKNGNFAEALAAFEQQDSAEALYNQGNSLAKLGDLEAAREAYEKALAKNPELTEAIDNKQAVETLIEQQKQQQEQENQSGEPSENGDNKQNSDEQSDGESQENSEQKSDEGSDKSSEQNSEQNSEQGESQQSDDASGEDQNQQSEQNANDDSSDSTNKNSDKDSEQNPSESSSSSQNEENKPSDEELAQYKQALEEELKKQQEQLEQDTVSQEPSLSEEQDYTEEQDNTEKQETVNAQVLSPEEQAALEDQQHQQQLFKKLTDNPALLLRNKMRLEYQKRRQERRSSGVNKQW